VILIVSVNTSLDRILVLDQLVPGHVHRVLNEFVLSGGKAFNVLRILGALGQAAHLVGLVGGHTGAMIRELAERDGFAGRVSWVPTHGDSRMCDIILDRAAHLSTVINAQGPAIRPQELKTLVETAEAMMTGGAVKWLVLSGSIPPNLESRLYADLIERARRHRVATIADVAGPTLVHTILATPTVVKVNAGEFLKVADKLSRLFDIPLGDGDAWPQKIHPLCEALVARGTDVIITDGANGSVSWSRLGRFRVSALNVTALNPIGSGDAFLAGYLHGVLSAEDSIAALKWAAVVSGSSAAHLLPEIDPIDRLVKALGRIQVQRWTEELAQSRGVYEP
jgi:1-phosphofructokinase family hexose kinase